MLALVVVSIVRGGGVPGGLDGGGGGVEQDWDCGRILGVLYYPFQVFPSSIK